ncbi:hypothetical protein BH11ARM1_BH11ARM1_12020 [soil metagenome]
MKTLLLLGLVIIGNQRPTPHPTLGLEHGTRNIGTPDFALRLTVTLLPYLPHPMDSW